MPQQTKTVEAAASPDHNPKPLGEESRLTTILSVLLAIYLALLTAGLLAAMAGLHHAIVVGPLAVVLALLFFKQLPDKLAIPKLGRVVAALLTLLVIASVIGNVALRSNLVVAGRDGGTYANTGAFLVDGADLFPDGVAEPFVGEDVEFAAPGFVLRDDGTLSQQFLHSTSALLGFVGELFGRGAMFSVNGLVSGIGVLSLFALGRRFMSEWWALSAASVMALSLPFLYYARGTFAEIPTLVLVTGGLWAAHVAIEGQPRFALGAGLLLGGAAMVRVDAWMVGVSLVAFLFTTEWLSEKHESWVASRMLSGFAIMGILGLIDITLFSLPYLALLRANLIPLLAMFLVVRLALPIARTSEFRSLADYLQERNRQAAFWTTAALSGLVVFLWFVRPFLEPARAEGFYGLEAIQIREGLAVDPTRYYSELSVWWITWYIGVPLTALGFAGFIAATRRSLERGRAATRLVVLIFFVTGFTYIARPSVNPDQIWAIRRFAPIVIPGLILFAFGLMAHFYTRQQGGTRTRSLIVAFAIAACVPVAFASAPLIGVADRPNVEAQFVRLCDGLAEAESVLLVDDVSEQPLSGLIGPPLRAWCGVNIAGASPELAGTLGADAVIARSPDLIPGGAALSHILEAEAWEASLTGAPDATEIRSIELYVGFADR